MWPFKQPIRPVVTAALALIRDSPEKFAFVTAVRDGVKQHHSTFLADSTDTINMFIKSNGSVEMRTPLSMDLNKREQKAVFEAAQDLSLKKLVRAIRDGVFLGRFETMKDAFPPPAKPAPATKPTKGKPK